MDICPKCGLPKQACVCEEIVKSEQRIQVTTEKKKFGKIVTVVSGIEKGLDIKKIAKELKEELGCGGTIRENNQIELQGDHTRKIRAVLIRLGFQESSINI
ncbi:MAG TPA: stress response translation initiation inhibitor YciH [Candidatus Paceibacterota bacterium]|nr:stress response translation initiation inhibitor YciH [Candidatus Paceibacterota bacterium]